MNLPWCTVNFPMGLTPVPSKFMIPCINFLIDLGQFTSELMKFRYGEGYDKAYLKQVSEVVVTHAVSLYFINALNTFMMAYGLPPTQHLTVLEFNHIHSYLHEELKPMRIIFNDAFVASSSSAEKSNDQPIPDKENANMDSTTVEINSMENAQDVNAPMHLFGASSVPIFTSPQAYTSISQDKSTSILPSLPSHDKSMIKTSQYTDKQTETDIHEDVFDHEDHIGAVSYLEKEHIIPIYATKFTRGLIEHKLEEAVKLVQYIPSEKLDIALSLVLKKTYIMDKNIRNRMHKELVDVKEQVNNHRMRRIQVKEKEDSMKKVRIFLGRK